MSDFHHRQSAHCESGVVANMLTHHGLAMSEPMAFGLSASLTFAYMPIIKLAGMPLIAYRMLPGNIIRGVEKRVGLRWERTRFSDPAEAERALDAALDAGRAVGLQTCVYWLPYFPEQMRFHFNAHNLVVYGRDGDDYLVSDPLFETTVRCDRASMQRARFAKGDMEPKGLMYYPTGTPGQVDYAAEIPKAIRWNAKTMQAPVPIAGIKGIRFLGRNIVKLSREANRDTYLPLYLGHIVRMQEEIGTGGAGFRFIYASFLQEASRLLDRPDWAEAARDLTAAGDEWRRFALRASKMCRGRAQMDVQELDAILNDIADRELAVWKRLRAA
ncbi:BtrH N-terminal domain-containing protein [Brevundimonas sp. FT23028]|uniref:BtrH N-terminal domain-containing protein n=1 Tax=Brevundimonas sp. FT23028 TaxID=3393748 RepID=UPI003B58B420